MTVDTLIAALIAAEDAAPKVGQILEPGESVSFTVAGIQGEKGDTGERGEQGPKGDTGATGATGPIGPQGQPGRDGTDGAPGLPGEPGMPGARGLKGDKGPKGDTGDAGPRGATGPRGPAGGRGVSGWMGSGADGGGGTGSLTILDEGVSQGPATSLDFAGAGVSVATVGGVATVTVPGGGGGAGTLEDTLALGNTTGENTIVMPMGVINGTTALGSVRIAANDAGSQEGASLRWSPAAAAANAGAFSFQSGDYDDNVGPYGSGITMTGATPTSGSTLILRGGQSADADGHGGVNVYLTGGDQTTDGQLVVQNLPTADPVVAGAVWTDSGVLVLSGSTAPSGGGAPSFLSIAKWV